jgi:hypothetical protein
MAMMAITTNNSMSVKAESLSTRYRSRILPGASLENDSIALKLGPFGHFVLSLSRLGPFETPDVEKGNHADLRKSLQIHGAVRESPIWHVPVMGRKPKRKCQIKSSYHR